MNLGMWVCAYYRVREGWVSNPIEVITEMPRKRSSRGVGTGGTTGRRLYSDIGITMVDDGRLPSALDFRDGGNASLFSFETRVAPSSSPPPDGGTPEERQYQQQQQQQHMSAEGVVELTLRTARERWNKNPQTRSSRRGNSKNDLGRTFLTGVEREPQYGEENCDIETQQRRGEGGLFSTGDTEGDEQAATTSGSGLAGFDAATATLERGGMSTRLLQGPVDPIVRGNPVKLRMAVTALRYTLKHPVTSSMDVHAVVRGSARPENTVTTGGGDEDRAGIGRNTAAARARQLPRRPYQLLKAHHHKLDRIGIESPDGARGRTGGLRTAAAGGTDLGRVDDMLTSMEAGMDEMTLENRAKENEDDARTSGRRGLSAIIRTVNAVLDESEY